MYHTAPIFRPEGPPRHVTHDPTLPLRGDACAVHAAPALAVNYENANPEILLEAPDVIAVLGFGGTAPTLNDPRYLRVGLEPFDAPAPFEVWRSPGTATFGRAGDLRWSAIGDYLFGAIELDEAAHGGLAAATAEAYRRVLDFVATCDHPYLLRLWNYLAAINDGEADDERYKIFCSGRADGIGTRIVAPFPAASAIGRKDDVRTLQVYWLAARSRGIAIENPRQISAWRYPRRYGPTPPTFARAIRFDAAPAQLHISGTAAVVGHASQHAGDLPAQLHETFANLASLFASAGIAPDFRPDDVLKIYVRHIDDAACVTAELDRRLPRAMPRLVLIGDICRNELLVEIDGVCRA